MSDKKPIAGPYRATKLWNDAVRSFYNGMPLSRHWRGLRQYDNCFTAADAIDWLHQHLRNDPNFGTSVSREQTIKLLRKFVKSGLIEEVKSSKSNVDSFKDNRDLYRFSNRSPLKALRTPKTPGRPALASMNKNLPDYGSSPVLRRHVQGSSKTCDTASLGKPTLGKLDAISFVRRSTRRYKGDNAINIDKENKSKSKDKPESNLPECHLVHRPLTQEEQEEVWKHVLIGKLDCLVHKMLSCDPLPLFDPSLARGAWIQHNMTKLTSRGVVQVAPGHIDDLPKWILTAMRCLAHWPNTSDSSCNIPNYPGVEADVFKIVRDFFTNMAVPLIPYELYEAVVRVYIGAEFLDITYRSPDRSGSSVSSPSISFENYNPEDLVTSDSVENLMLNMSISGQQKTSTPFLGEENRGSSLRHREEHSEDHFQRQGSIRSTASVNNPCASSLCTPSNHGNSFTATNLQSLKLRRLKNYTDFKETNLYPTLLEGSHEESALNEDDTRLVFGQKGVDLSKISDTNHCVRGVTYLNNAAHYTRHSHQNSGGNVLCQLLKANKESEQRLACQGCSVFVHDSAQPYVRCKNVNVNQVDAFCVPSGAKFNGDREGCANHYWQKSNGSSSIDADWKCSEGGGVKRKRVYDDNTFLSSSELLGLDLPPNSCFETAFTSDSPRTRIIPQKSVDTIHFRNMSKSKSAVLSRKRPKSIAVTSASASDVKGPFLQPWGQGHIESKNISTMSDLFKSSIMSGNISEQYVTPPESIQSPMNRSRSTGNLGELVQNTESQSLYHKCSPDSVSLHSVCDVKPELDYRQEVPSRGAVGYVKARDSIRRKRIREDSLTRKRLHANNDIKDDDDGGNYPELNHMRTRSGGYMNFALTTSCEGTLESPVDDLCDDKVSLNLNLNHMRTKSGGFVNLALAPSNLSLEDEKASDTLAAPLTSRSDSCMLDKPKAFLQQHRIRAKTPDGCLSHSLSSGSCSVYHSALSLTGRSCTPTSHHSLSSAKEAPALPPRSPVPSTWPQQIEGGGMIHDYENVFDNTQRPLSVSATNLSDRWADRTPFGQTPPYAKNGVWRHYHSSPSKRVIGRKKGLEYYYGSKACLPGLLTREGKDVAISALQLLLLLLPPVRRRKLHLLLLMMNKASNNDKLSLDPQHTTRALVLNTLTRCVLLCDQEADYDEVLAVRIVTFLMDNHEQVMKPPQELSVLVHRKISQMHKDQVVYGSLDDADGTKYAYCRQVSQNQYEKQRLTGSQLFLTELLDQILQNSKLSEKEKKKKLKEFKTLYPDIYRARFPKEAEKPTESSSKIRSLMKLASLTSLGKGKSMRL